MVKELGFEVERFGDPARPALLLVQGLAQQLTDWPAPLIEALAAEHHVVVFDNRDSGLSAKFGLAARTSPRRRRPIRCPTWRRMRPG